MKSKNAAASALMAVFPTIEAFIEFRASRDNRRTVESFADFAFARGLIDQPDPESLQAYIRSRTGAYERAAEEADLDFETLMQQKDRLLEFNLSMRALTERINALITHNRVELPRVSNSMLSRLKKETADTPHKRNALRSLVFWIGHERPHLARQFNYETLLRLCRAGRPAAEHKQGVRIGFALYSRGDVIDHEIVGWVKKILKAYIEDAIGRFAYGRFGKVRSHGMTTLYVDFPKETETSNPAAYRQCLRSGVSLAHQMAIRWSLSPHGTHNRFLSIGIAAGEFSVLDNYLLPVLNAKLAGDPVIRLTDYARQCVLINDIRVIMGPQPAEISLFSGQTLPVWWVEGFWSTLYFDFIPELLSDPVLSSAPAPEHHLAGRLWVASAAEAPAGQGNASNAVSAFLKFPHNSLVGLEIAKTLYYRRRFWEAVEILRIVLSLDPERLNARTLRMILLRNLAIEAPSYPIASGLFLQAEQEADFIQRNCACESEEFYCEYAVLHLARAMNTLRAVRSDSLLQNGGGGSAYYRDQVFSDLRRAESLFARGVTVSPTGIRSVYLLNTVLVIRALLKNNPEIFVNPDLAIDGDPEVVRRVNRDFHWQLGYIGEDSSKDAASVPWLDEIFANHMISHDDSIALQAYRPTTYFCAAVAWWDLFPVRTAKTAARAVKLLEDAADMAADIAAQDVCIYSFTRAYGEMIPVPDFIEHLHRGIRMIREQAGGDLTAMEDDEVIEPVDPDRAFLLMTLNY